MPAPVLDGMATGQSSGSTTLAATLTTTGTNRVICALVYLEKFSPVPSWVTGVSGGGLTWNKRTQATVFTGSGTPLGAYDPQTLELWWALAPSALAAVPITATFTAASDDAAILVFGVSGCNTTTPWDSDASLAARKVNFGGIAPSFANISTAQANDFLIFGFGSNTSQGMGTLPTGFTTIGSTVNGGGSRYASIGACYRGVTATQTAQTFTWGSAFTTAQAAVLFDALTADTGGSTTAPRPTWEMFARKGLGATSTITVDVAGFSANDVIVLATYCLQTAGVAVSTVTGGGLTWTRRARTHGSTRGNLEIWSAQVTGTLASSTITVTYAAAVDSASVLAMALTGVDAARWDANAGVPAMASNAVAGSWTASVPSVATSSARDLVLAVLGVSGNAGTSVPSGFMLLDQVVQGGSSWNQGMSIGIQTRAATRSSAAVAWGAAVTDSAAGVAAGEYLVDALTADAPVIVSTQAVRIMVLA